MAKVLVELKEASLLDLIGHQYIMAGEPHVANLTSLISSAIADGRMKLIARLKDGASEEELKKAKDVKAFLAKFDAEAKAPANNGNNGNNGGNNNQKN